MSDLVDYYAARAHEYEQVYAKPERQQDLSRLHDVVPPCFVGRRVLEVACGTGYWTRRIAPHAAHVTACDRSPEVLALARAQQPPTDSVEFREIDAFALSDLEGTFDAAFVGFWISHVLERDVRRFLDGLHWRLRPGSVVLLVDNRYVPGSNWPITRTDADGNTYQNRRLNDGSEYEVLKNFPLPLALHEAIEASGGTMPAIRELTYYWYAAYTSGV